MREHLIGTVVTAIATVICILGTVAAATHFYVVEQQNLKESLAVAMDKGVDPLAVRCSYAKQTDTICVSYAASVKTPSKP